MDNSPYMPEEDTYFLLDFVKCRGRVLDMGTGTGVIANHCARLGFDVTAVDVNSKALVIAERRYVGNRIKFIKSNLFGKVKGVFDTIIFNPPYLPGNYDEDPAIYGGKKGQKIIDNFLIQAKDHLSAGGSIFIIFSSYNDVEELKKRHYYYVFKKLGELKLSFHTIFVYELKKP